MRAFTFTDVIQQGSRYALLLLDPESQEIMAIWTDFYAGTTIGWISQGCPDLWSGNARPGIFQFSADALALAGANFTGVVIKGVEKDVFEASIRFDLAGRQHVLDARPADAIALAVLLGKPILVDPESADSTRWRLESVYSRTTFGKPTQALLQSLKSFWAAQDPRIYPNCMPGAGVDAAGGLETHGLKLADILGEDPVERTVMFWDNEGKRMLPVRMPAWEAGTLAWQCGGKPRQAGFPDRSHTYRLAAGVLRTLGFEGSSVRIYSLSGGVYNAAVHLRTLTEDHVLDLRVSDAAALALELRLPFYACTPVLDAAGTAPQAHYRSRDEIGRGLSHLIREIQRTTLPKSNWARMTARILGG